MRGAGCPILGWILSHSWREHCLEKSPPASQRYNFRDWSSGSTLAGNSPLPRQRLICSWGKRESKVSSIYICLLLLLQTNLCNVPIAFYGLKNITSYFQTLLTVSRRLPHLQFYCLSSASLRLLPSDLWGFSTTGLPQPPPFKKQDTGMDIDQECGSKDLWLR